MKCYEITFSPTGGTQKAADLLTKELSGECTAVDLTIKLSKLSERNLKFETKFRPTAAGCPQWR